MVELKKNVSILFSLLLVASLLVSPSASAVANSKTESLAKEVFKQAENKQNADKREREPNDTFENANEVAIGESYKGTFIENDKDFYKVTVKGEGKKDLVVFLDEEDTASKDMNFNITVYDSNKNEMNFYKTKSSGYYFAAFYKLQPGVYYIETSDMLNGNNGEEYKLYTDILEHEEPSVARIDGEDRYETAARISFDAEGRGYPENVVLATGEDYPDALAATPLAYHLGGPILLTTQDELPEITEEALEHLRAKNITIVGGTGAVSAGVENYLRDKLGYHVDRIAGKDRYETAAAVAEELPDSDTAVVAYGKNFPDAISVASYAAHNMMPILLTETDEVPEATKQAIANYEHSYVIGGKGVISKEVAQKLPNPTRLSGEDRYATSVAIANHFKADINFASVATGEGFADALAGSRRAAGYNHTLLLTPQDHLHPAVEAYFKDKETRYYTILGGKGAVGENVEKDIWELVK